MDETKFKELFEKYVPVQNPDEFLWLIGQVERTEPKAIMEIGLERGGSFQFWHELLPVGGRLIGLDAHIYENLDFTKSNRRVTLLKADSRLPETPDKIRILLNGEQLDFLYIDGDHGYEACKGDFVKYSQFVRQGGLVGFHDTTAEINNVGRFFAELRAQYPADCEEHPPCNGQGTGIYWKR